MNTVENSTISLIEIANEFDTPLYVYDAEKIQTQYGRLKNALQGCNAHIHFACKSLNNIVILKLMKKIGAGLDTVSIQEIELAKRAGFNSQEIVFTPNGVSFDEIKMAVDEGVMINLDNLSALDRFGYQFGNSIPVGIRINPNISAGGHYKISTGHIDSKFGISIYQLRHVERIVKTHNMRINGLHMHTGSDILDTEVFMQGAEILFDAAKNFPDLEYLDFGSGFKVPYKPNDYETEIEELGKSLVKRFNEFCDEYKKALRLIVEPGKFLVSEAGIFLVKVNIIKHTTATVFAAVNSGFNHLIRPMFYDAYHHINNISNPDGPPRIYTVAGYICETDTFAWDRKVEEIREGDILCFHNAGAYGMTMASNYNARLRPAEVMIYEGKAHLIRRRESLDDLLITQLELKLF
jgi:diaminopimelate decarboxylase